MRGEELPMLAAALPCLHQLVLIVSPVAQLLALMTRYCLNPLDLLRQASKRPRP